MFPFARQTFALELKNEENVMNAPYFTIQCALLYSTSYGERRIRVHTIQVLFRFRFRKILCNIFMTAGFGGVYVGSVGGLWLGRFVSVALKSIVYT
jgi:hypothetical protein